MRKTVLLVEDEAKLADVLAQQLAEEGFDVRQAGSLRQALRVLDDLVPDIAIIDIGLPDGSGLDVLRRLRCGADRLDSGTPALLLTARTEEVDVLRGFERGADDYLRKPFALPELIARVHALLVRGRRVHATSASASSCWSLRRAARRGRAGCCRSRGANTTFCWNSRAIPARCARRPICCARSGACRRPCARARSIHTRAACAGSSWLPVHPRIRS